MLSEGVNRVQRRSPRGKPCLENPVWRPSLPILQTPSAGHCLDTHGDLEPIFARQKKCHQKIHIFHFGCFQIPSPNASGTAFAEHAYDNVQGSQSVWERREEEEEEEAYA